MKHLKFFFLALFFISLQAMAVAQTNTSRMEREKSQRSAAIEREANQGNSPWIYSVAHITVKNGKVEVQVENTQSKPKSEEEAQAMDMQRKATIAVQNAMVEFTTETDVLNYFSQLGMELVTVLPEGDFNSDKKVYYFRSRMN